MADDKEPERMDAPNKQAVGLDPPWVEGTGGKAVDPVKQAQKQSAEQVKAGEEVEPEPAKPKAKGK